MFLQQKNLMNDWGSLLGTSITWLWTLRWCCLAAARAILLIAATAQLHFRSLLEHGSTTMEALAVTGDPHPSSSTCNASPLIASPPGKPQVSICTEHFDVSVDSVCCRSSAANQCWQSTDMGFLGLLVRQGGHQDGRCQCALGVGGPACFRQAQHQLSHVLCLIFVVIDQSYYNVYQSTTYTTTVPPDSLSENPAYFFSHLW